MIRIFSSLKETVLLKKNYFIFLLILTIASIVLGVFAGINVSSGILVVDLTNIAYIQFLTNDCGFVTMIFKLLFSLLVFYLLIYICNIKPFLVPLSIIFFMYLVYSQTVVFISIIMLYGFFNSIILCLLLLIYILILFFLFILLCLELNRFCNCHNYFSSTFNFSSSNVLTLSIAIIISTLIFCVILAILKSFVILLVYWLKNFTKNNSLFYKFML